MIVQLFLNIVQLLEEIACVEQKLDAFVVQVEIGSHQEGVQMIRLRKAFQAIKDIGAEEAEKHAFVSLIAIDAQDLADGKSDLVHLHQLIVSLGMEYNGRAGRNDQRPNFLVCFL